jgi:dTDP-4-dehydrorhamnose 3,5-epimerase
VSAPRLIPGGIAVDDRGELVFANEFDFAGVKRFYMVSNHQPNFVRAWHAHRREGKYVVVVQGAAIVAAVEIDNWETPNRQAQVHRFVLSASQPRVLFIPPGYANGFKSLASDTKVMFFSTASIEESRGDDVRFDARYWDVWSVEER